MVFPFCSVGVLHGNETKAYVSRGRTKFSPPLRPKLATRAPPSLDRVPPDRRPLALRPSGRPAPCDGAMRHARLGPSPNFLSELDRISGDRDRMTSLGTRQSMLQSMLLACSLLNALELTCRLWNAVVCRCLVSEPLVYS